MSKKVKLLERLVAEGHFDSQKEAAAFVMSGQVYVDGKRAQSGMTVAPDACLSVRGRELPFVSKGGLKLQGAIDDFSIDVKDRVCIDAGASTGGFTDCLVKNGAALVYAVDVGYGQLMGSLRQNPRVCNMERTNIGNERLLSLDPVPTLGSVDLSYLSLRKGIPYFASILRFSGELMCLVKPLFEVDDAEARRTGVLRDEAYPVVLEALIRDVNQMQKTRVLDVTHSPVTGNAGTREFFLHVAFGENLGNPLDLREKIQSASARAAALAPYHKEG